MLKKWSDRSLMKFSKGKCEVLCMRKNNPTHQYCIRGQSAGKQICSTGPVGLHGQQAGHGHGLAIWPETKGATDTLGCFSRLL